MLNPTKFNSRRVVLAVVVGMAAIAPVLADEAEAGAFDNLLTLRGAADGNAGRIAAARIPAVREAVLRDTALVLGVQWGLGDRSREIERVLEASTVDLDKRFNFGRLLLGASFLPPVIHEARDVRSLEGRVFRAAKVTYTIAEPPRPVVVAPTWRDWLYLGLDPTLRPAAPAHGNLLPRDEAETAFWQRTLRAAYAEGRKQADDVYLVNLAALEATHRGMERYYDLYKRGVVSAPVIAQASGIADKKDPNTLVIGNTVIRVTIGAEFVDNANKWVPLAQ